MTPRSRGLLLLAIQCAIVAAVGAKFLYERATLPRAWVQVQNSDPEMTVRGRYLALQPLLDTCALPHTPANVHEYKNYATGKLTRERVWYVTMVPRNGRLEANDTGKRAFTGEYGGFYAADHPPNSFVITEDADKPCGPNPFREALPYFVPEHARAFSGIKWALVSLPKQGSPRVIRLADQPDPAR